MALLLHEYTWRYCIPFCNARAKSEGSQFRRLHKPPKINASPYQRPLGYCKTYVNLIIPMHISTKAETLVKIGLVLAEIFSGIC